MDDIHEKLRLVEVKAAELIKLADSIDAGVYLESQRAAVDGMQNMLRRWQRWQLREALIAFGIAECHLPCPQRGMVESIENIILTAENAGNAEK